MLLQLVTMPPFESFDIHLSCVGPTSKSCADEDTSMPTPNSTAANNSAFITSTETPPTSLLLKPSTLPAPIAKAPSKVVGVRVTPSVQNASPTLTVTWQAVAGGAVNYTVKYSTRPGEVNTPPEGALEVKGIGVTSTILTALERGTTYYIWVVGVSEGGEGPHSDRMSGVTNDSELDSTNCTPLLYTRHMCECLKACIHLRW